MHIRHDARGRELLSDMPTHFTLPNPKRISTLDFHRARLIEQREAMRAAIEAMREDSEHETFREANDFAVEDPFDDEISRRTDFELDDDAGDGLEALAREEYQRTVAETSVANRKNMKTSTEAESRPESQP